MYYSFMWSCFFIFRKGILILLWTNFSFFLYICVMRVFPLKGMFFGVPFSLYDFFCPDGNFFIFTSLFELKENSSLFFQRVAMSHWDVFCKCLGKLIIFLRWILVFGHLRNHWNVKNSNFNILTLRISEVFEIPCTSNINSNLKTFSLTLFE